MSKISPASPLDVVAVGDQSVLREALGLHHRPGRRVRHHHDGFCVRKVQVRGSVG